jgi:hypothetical protein
MSDKRSGPPPSSRSSKRAAEPRLEDEDGHEDERYGIVLVARHVKDDARALILYSTAPERPE